MLAKPQRRRAYKPAFNPTAEQIREACRRIQSRWSQREEASRRTGPQFDAAEFAVIPVRDLGE